MWFISLSPNYVNNPNQIKWVMMRVHIVSLCHRQVLRQAQLSELLEQLPHRKPFFGKEASTFSVGSTSASPNFKPSNTDTAYW